eukprot:scaffold3477_cov175-Amphora_coffeaeformis.AAC.6
MASMCEHSTIPYPQRRCSLAVLEEEKKSKNAKSPRNSENCGVVDVHAGMAKRCQLLDKAQT